MKDGSHYDEKLVVEWGYDPELEAWMVNLAVAIPNSDVAVSSASSLLEIVLVELERVVKNLG